MATSRELISVTLGLVAAGFGPLVGGTLFYVVHGELNIIASAAVISLIIYPVALIFAGIFGLPLFLLARRFNLVRWWSAIACGLIVGCGVQFLVLNGTHDFENLLIYAIMGMTSALLFFAVWRCRSHA